MTGSRRFVLIGTILGSAMVFIDGTVVTVALPAMQNDLGGGLSAQQWVVDAYLLTLGSLILVGGSLGDIFGPVRMFTVGVAAFGVASVLCALAPDINALIVFRGVQGVAGALLTPASLAVITTCFTGAERGAAIGTWTAWSGISTIVGPVVGGWLIDVASWRAIFFINIPVAIVTVLIALFRMPHAHQGRSGTRVDVVGAVLCALGLGGVVFALIEQPRLGWTHWAIVLGLVGGVALLVGFVWWERRVAQPMLPLRLFRSRNFTVTNIETLAVYGGLSAWGFFLILYLQQLGGWSPLRAGLATVPVTLVLFFLSRYAGRFSAQHGPRLFMALGPMVGGLALLALARLPTNLSYWADLLPPLLGFAVGLSLTVAPLTTTVLSDAGPGDAGIASGVNNAVARVAGLVAIAGVGLAASRQGKAMTEHGFHVSMVIVAGLLCLGGLIGAIGIRNPD
jgi:EmrB/QacA subfamily drug resistance transporter